MNDNDILKLFNRLMKYLDIYYKIYRGVYDDGRGCSMGFFTTDTNKIMIFKSQDKTFKVVPFISIRKDENTSEKEIILTTFRYMMEKRLEFVIQENTIPNDLLSPRRKSSFRLPETFEQLEILLTTSGY